MDKGKIARIAGQVASSHLARDQYQPLAQSDRTEHLSDAYQIQAAVYEYLGQRGGYGLLGGHKIALTSPAIQELVGLSEPIYGSVFQSQIYKSGHQIDLSSYVRLGLEFEIAVEIQRDVPPADQIYTAGTIAPYVGACMPAFELIEDRGADYAHLDAFSLIADRCWCSGAVVGVPVTDVQAIDLSKCESQMRLNGDVVATANTGLAMGHPFNGLAWVANFLAASGRQLRAGEIVITGSALKTYFVEPGDEVSYEVQGLGSVSVSVV